MEFISPGIFVMLITLIHSYIVYSSDNKISASYFSWVLNEVKLNNVERGKIPCIYAKFQFYNANLNIFTHFLIVIFSGYSLLTSSLFLIFSSIVTYFISDSLVKKNLLSGNK